MSHRHLSLLISICLFLLAQGCKGQQAKQTSAHAPDAPSSFVQAEKAFARYQQYQLKSSYPDATSFREDLKHKANLFSIAKKHYKDTFTSKQHEWSIASLTRAGDLHMDFAKQLYNAPPIDLETLATNQIRRVLIRKGIPKEVQQRVLPKLLARVLPRVQRSFRIRMIKRGNFFAEAALSLYKRAVKKDSAQPGKWSIRAKEQLKRIKFYSLPLKPKS